MKKTCLIFLALVISVINVPTANASTYTLKVEVKVDSDWSYYEGAPDYDGNGEYDDFEDARINYAPSPSDLASASQQCRDGWNDYKIALNSSIKAINESGKTIGLGKLSKVGVFTNSEAYGDIFSCKYSGVLKVTSAKFYKVLIDGRNGPEYSFSDLKKFKWSIKLTI